MVKSGSGSDRTVDQRISYSEVSLCSGGAEEGKSADSD